MSVARSRRCQAEVAEYGGSWVQWVHYSGRDLGHEAGRWSNRESICWTQHWVCVCVCRVYVGAACVCGRRPSWNLCPSCFRGVVRQESAGCVWFEKDVKACRRKRMEMAETSEDSEPFWSGESWIPPLAEGKKSVGPNTIPYLMVQWKSGWALGRRAELLCSQEKEGLEWE